MIPPKSKKEQEEDIKELKEKLMDPYDQSQDLDGGMSSWTYNMGELNTGETVTTAGGWHIADEFDIKFNDQPGFDFDHDLRKKYPALKDAYDHYQNIKQMCETREREEAAS